MVEILRTPAEIIAACQRAIEEAPREYPPDLPPSKELLGAPAWYPFESRGWPIGEALRQSLKATPALRRNKEVLEAIVRVVESVNLRRARQSFVMSLGYKDAAPFAPRVARFLGDSDVGGHVLDALIKMRADGYADAVRPLLEARHNWIRKKAKQYLERFGVAA